MTAHNDFWNDAENARKIMRERSSLEEIINRVSSLESIASNAEAALELGRESKEEEFLKEADSLIKQLGAELERQEFLRMMIGEFDKSGAILEINCGAGGTEAQDWADMLLRMYMRWAERKGFSIEVADHQPGEGAGIKSATVLIEGEYAYGFLRGEQGVHRLVRISPFDANARRHTSFASVTVTPEIEEDIDIEINEADLKIDTYRSGGAGGQHVNKTDSAVRITHIPTNIIVACQSQRSQHKNKDAAMKMLKAKLYEKQREEQYNKIEGLRGERRKIEFGSQIRSYVLQPYQMIKDLRTEYESSNITAILDGDIDAFIEHYLMSEENRPL